ncbi:hypothetical protein RAH57_09050 [Chryseobacterium sp. CKR4-1]|uniref:hypothetical protein n=1 Tax=Chryseobacterium sp. CKR4-1 TaxID=3068896 RepID=UPI002796C1F5|nr:hypothetical protein [Chryseobacterium sp. CKR4-1]MDQ1804134.1 hypothetical protein [Chryseobacterium sp. CKR4-1]
MATSVTLAPAEGGLRAKPINDTTIEWRVKIDNKYGRDYSKTLLEDAAGILSQNGVTYKIIEDPKALFTIELAPAKVTEDPITKDPITTNGYTIPDGNTYDGKVVSKTTPDFKNLINNNYKDVKNGSTGNGGY